MAVKKEAALKNKGCESHEKIMQQPLLFRVIAAAMFYPEKMYDKEITFFVNSLGQVGYICSELPKAWLALPRYYPANEFEIIAIKQIG